MCELFNVAFGFALVFMKATLDTDTPVALFACVGRCFTVDALLTHGITTVEKEPLSALGAVPQSPLADRALCHPRVAPLASPRPQGDVPTFQAGGSLTSPLQPAPALAFPRGSGRAAHATPGPLTAAGAAKGRPRGKGAEPRGGRGWAAPSPLPPLPPRSRTGPSSPAPAAVPPERYLHGGAGRLQGRGERGATAAASAATSSPSRFRLRHPGSPARPGRHRAPPRGMDGRGPAQGPLPRRHSPGRAGRGPGGGQPCRTPVLRLLKRAKGPGYGCSTTAPRYSPFPKGSRGQRSAVGASPAASLRRASGVE